MKKIILLLILTLIGFSSQAQNTQKKDSFLKEIYNDFLKYGTVYGAGEISNSIEAKNPTYFVRTAENGSIYSIPVVVDNTPNDQDPLVRPHHSASN